MSEQTSYYGAGGHADEYPMPAPDSANSSGQWRYEVRGSSLYDLIENRPLSIFEAGEILNAHQKLLITTGVWAAKAGLAEVELTTLRADTERLLREAQGFVAAYRDGLTAAAYETVPSMWKSAAQATARRIAAFLADKPAGEQGKSAPEQRPAPVEPGQ